MPGPGSTPDEVRKRLDAAENPPAFPRSSAIGGVIGMTLRDFFAAAALAGIFADPDDHERSINEDAMMAYLAADAMLLEREK